MATLEENKLLQAYTIPEQTSHTWSDPKMTLVQNHKILSIDPGGAPAGELMQSQSE